MTVFNEKLATVVEENGRYAYEAYEFVFQALSYTQKLLDREPPPGADAPVTAQHHVSGTELLRGIRGLAQREFGLMARTVFHMWGINRTDDFGEIVFHLVQAGLMSKTDDDCRADFHDVYDLDQALVQDYRIQLDEAR